MPKLRDNKAQMHTEIFKKQDFELALKKVSRRIDKPKSSPKPPQT